MMLLGAHILIQQLVKLEFIEQLKLKFITFIKVLLILFNILPITVI